MDKHRSMPDTRPQLVLYQSPRYGPYSATTVFDGIYKTLRRKTCATWYAIALIEKQHTHYTCVFICLYRAIW